MILIVSMLYALNAPIASFDQFVIGFPGAADPPVGELPIISPSVLIKSKPASSKWINSTNCSSKREKRRI